MELVTLFFLTWTACSFASTSLEHASIWLVGFVASTAWFSCVFLACVEQWKYYCSSLSIVGHNGLIHMDDIQNYWCDSNCIDCTFIRINVTAIEQFLSISLYHHYTAINWVKQTSNCAIWCEWMEWSMQNSQNQSTGWLSSSSISYTTISYLIIEESMHYDNYEHI